MLVSWKILDVKSRSVHCSPQFEAFGCLWRIKFFPYAYDDENFGYCAVALFFDGPETEEHVFVQGCFALTTNGDTVFEWDFSSQESTSVHFRSGKTSHGNKRFIRASDVGDCFLAHNRDLLLELKEFTVVRPLWQCVQPVAPDLRFATMVNGRYVFVSDPEALLCRGQVLSISGNIDDAHNKVSVEDRLTDPGDDGYSDFSRGN